MTEASNAKLSFAMCTILILPVDLPRRKHPGKGPINEDIHDPIVPEEIELKDHFDIKVEGRSDETASVVMLRSDHNTHSLTTGDRFGRLAFDPKGNPRKGELRVHAPRLPSQAIAGIYTLFVLNKQGVPSLAKGSI